MPYPSFISNRAKSVKMGFLQQNVFLMSTILYIQVLAVAGQSSLDLLGYQVNDAGNVFNELEVAKDIGAMRAAGTDFDLKKAIYTSGSDDNAGSLTLQSLSLQSGDQCGQYPMYRIYTAGFDLLGQEVEGDNPGFFDGKPVERYADTLVNDLFLLNVANIEAEAALSLNVVMAFYCSLYGMLTSCQSNLKNTAIDNLDKAAAFYVGADQIPGDDATGYSLYNLAQFVGERFNQFKNDGEPEVVVNSFVIASFKLIQSHINSDKCQSDEGYLEIRDLVKRLWSSVNQILVQMLIHRAKNYEVGKPTDFVELYSLSLLPQVAACDSDLFSDLLRYTVSLNVDASTEPSVFTALQNSYSCFGLTCAEVGAYAENLVPQCDDGGVINMAGYVPSFDVRDKARLDRDIRMIRWMMQFNAFDAAREFYQYGWNSIFSLQQIARGETSEVQSADVQAAADFFGLGDVDFANQLVMEVFRRVGPFASTTDNQRLAYIDSLLRGMVMFIGILNDFDESFRIAKEEIDQILNAQKLWDAGVGFYIGSTEGPLVGGTKYKVPGESLYGLANKNCQDFGVCNANGKAIVNDDLLSVFTEVQQALLNLNLDDAETKYLQFIKPRLVVSLIQGFLNAMVEAGKDPEGPERGDAYGYSRMLLPLYNAISSNDVESLREITFPGTSLSSADVDDAFFAMENIIANPQVSTTCEEIGATQGVNNESKDICQGKDIDAPQPTPTTEAPNFVPAPVAAPVAVTRSPVAEKPVPEEHPQGLAFGRFTFTDSTVANRDAAVAQDIKRMWTASTANEAESVYISGVSFSGGIFGLTDVNTVQKFSTLARSTMRQDPQFNFYRYTFYKSDDFDGQQTSDVWDFGNKVVEAAIGTQNNVLAAETAVVLNVYNMIMRQLHEATRRCRVSSATQALSFLDSAVALWIGDEQGEGVYNSGYMMYSMAQLAMNHYGVAEGESPVNTELMQLFNEAQGLLQQCTNANPQNYKLVRLKVRQINTAFVKIFIQNWLWYHTAGDKIFLDLFSVALVPHLNACGTGSYDFLQQIVPFDGQAVGREIIIQTMAQAMDCLGITCEDLGATGPAESEALKTLEGTIFGLCIALKAHANQKFFAGYEAEHSGFGEESKLDLDVRQIGIMMEVEAYDTAREFYDDGYNSIEGTSFRTLANAVDYASNATIVADQLAGLWQSYYNIDQYPHQYIINIISGQGAYAQASRAQRTEAVIRMLQAGVSVLYVSQHLSEALQACSQGENGNSHVDSAAVFMIGWIEGSRSGGNVAGQGSMLYALANEYCDAFDQCESSGVATANELLIFALEDIKQQLAGNNCESAISIVQESLDPLLIVSIIQAMLANAEIAQALPAQSPLRQIAALDALAKSLLPEIDRANATSAVTIDDASDFNLNRKAVSSGVQPLFDALRFVMSPLGVDCDVIGTLNGVEAQTTCTLDEEIAPPTDTETILGDSLYTTTTYVKNLADIALDIKQMEDDLTVNEKELAELIYIVGQNSPVYDKFGIRTGVLSIAEFSRNASRTMINNPIFQVTVFALEDEFGEYLGADARQYADSVVLSLLSSEENTGTVGAEAAVALNIWMEIINELYQQLENCRNMKINDADGVHSIDEVAALYIGDGEISGNSREGHLLYNLGERMALKFDTVDDSGLATVNLKILRLLNQAKLDLSFQQACTGDSSTVRKLTRTVNKIVPQMLTVQVQALISAILEDDRSRVRVHAHAVVPLVRACNEATFESLYEKLLLANFVETEVDSLISILYSLLFCFGITCEDIGTHQEAQTGALCTEQSSLAPMVGYRPTTEVFEFAKLDLDIKYLDILTAQKAWGPAMDVYMFGLHSAGTAADGSSSVSLQSLATGAGRSVVPEYNTHVQYFGSDNNYADSIILDALSSGSSLSDTQRREIVVGTCQHMVMYMAILQSMYESVAACRAGSRADTSALLWDRAAAYIIGSLEGPVEEPYTARPGVFLWGLGKRYCPDWGTCPNIFTGSSLVNNEILSLLYTGRGAANVGSCQSLEKAANEMTSLLRVAIFQATLSEIQLTALNPDGPIRDTHFARAFAASQALIPLISKENRDDANIIRSYLALDGPILGGNSETEKRANAVATEKALIDNLDDLDVDCELVGRSDSVDACSGEVSEEKSNKLPLVIGITLGAIVGGALALLLFIYQSRKSRRNKDEEAKFIRNEQGVMDEAHMDYDPNEGRRQASGDEVGHSDAAEALPAEGMLTDVALPKPV